METWICNIRFRLHPENNHNFVNSFIHIKITDWSWNIDSWRKWFLLILQLQTWTSASASDQELSCRISHTHERRGSHFRTSLEGELWAEGAGGHEWNHFAATHGLQGEDQVREDAGEGCQAVKVRRSFWRPRLYSRRLEVQEIVLPRSRWPSGEFSSFFQHFSKPWTTKSNAARTQSFNNYLNVTEFYRYYLFLILLMSTFCMKISRPLPSLK